MAQHASVIVLACALTLQGCSPSKEDAPTEDLCLTITHDYYAAMQDALVCDPTEGDACGAGRPLMFAAQAEDGTETLQGICMDPCLAAVNPTRTAGLDEILRRFETVGCTYGRCACPPPSWMPVSCLEAGVCTGIAPER